MTVAEDRQRPDLGSLRIQRDDEPEPGGFPWGRLVVWTIVLVLCVVGGTILYLKVIAPGNAPTLEVIVARPSVNTVNQAMLSATGYLVADKQAKITPKISGKVVRLNFDTGTKVHRGDVLVVLESTNLQAQLDEAEANLGQAQREYDRQNTLWKEGLASRSILDNAEAQLKVARARANQIHINMNDMVVRAPFDGTIASKSTEVGEVISSVLVGQVAGTLPAGAIATLVDLSTLQVQTDVNETALSQIKAGQPAEISVDAFPGQKWKGYLKQIIPTADRSKGIVQVKVAIINPSDGLLPEMAATVSFLQTARTDAELREPAKFWLPEAVVNTEGTPRVAVLDAQNHVHLRNVTTGEHREGKIEIVKGIADGDRLAATPEGLKDGQLIKVTENQ